MPPHIDPAIIITPAISPQDLRATTSLFQSYVLSLGIDLTFQDFATELSTLPGKYAAPTGIILLARRGSPHLDPVGCVALRHLANAGDKTCEMKRLYVDPQGRGLGLGRRLAEAVIEESRKLGYESMVLDSLATMTEARGLYASLGFVETEAYYETPVKRTKFYRLDLKGAANG